jgi:hypothetical protein
MANQHLSDAERSENCALAHGASGVSRRSVIMNTVISAASLAPSMAIASPLDITSDDEIFALSKKISELHPKFVQALKLAEETSGPECGTPT